MITNNTVFRGKAVDLSVQDALSWIHIAIMHREALVSAKLNVYLRCHHCGTTDIKHVMAPNAG